MMLYTATYRFEVLDSDGAVTAGDPLATAARWVVYDSELVGGEDDSTGEHCIEEVWIEVPVDLAQQCLSEALTDLGGFRGGLPSRIVFWTDEGCAESPTVVIQASEEQMAIARLHAASRAVVEANKALNRARKQLRNQVLAAEVHTHLARNLIAREVEGGGWSRRLVLQFLAGHDLILAARRALPGEWPGYRMGFEEQYYYGEAVTEHLGPYWCGPVCMDLDAAGQVSFWLDYNDYYSYGDDDYVDDDYQPQPKPTEQEARQVAARDAAQRVEDADVVVSRLRRAGFELRTQTGAEAGVAELMDAFGPKEGLKLTRRK
jgi:hypothetical protein